MVCDAVRLGLGVASGRLPNQSACILTDVFVLKV